MRKNKYEDKNWLQSKYIEEGLSSRDIAEICGCSKTPILRALKEFNIEKHSFGRPTKGDTSFKNREWLYNKYWEEGFSGAEIAELCGCGHTTILECLKKFDIKRRLPGVVTDSNKQYRDEKWLRKAYLVEGKSSLGIARECGCAKSVVLKWMEVFDIPRRSMSEACFGRVLSEETREKISKTLHEKRGNHCNLSEYAYQWIDGELLGDGSLTTRSDFSARVNYCSKYEEYINYVSDTLKSFGIGQSGGISFIEDKEDNQYGKEGYSYRSLDYTELLPIRKRWYPDGKKIVPKDIKLSPLVCRQWFIGDGTLYTPKQGHARVYFAACGFTPLEVEFLVDKLMNLGFKAKRSSYNNTIYLSTYSVKDFLNYIGDCPVDCYQYKWMGNIR